MNSELKAGVAKVDITPPVGITMAGYGARERPSEGVLEPLQAVAVALEQGDRSCALVTADLIGIPRQVTETIRNRVGKLSGLPPERVFVSATHTHWGPALTPTEYLAAHLQEAISEHYTADMAMRLAGAVVQAWNSRQPVVAQAGTGDADGVSFNRRPVGPDGKVVMSLTMSPEAAHVASTEGARLARTWQKGGAPGERLSLPLEALGGARAGVSDPRLPVLRLAREDGSTLALLCAFGCHAVCGGDPDTLYLNSPDWPGAARDTVERVLDCTALVLAGACGDQVPRVRRGDSRQRIGTSVGAEAIRVCGGLDGPGIGPLGVASRTATIPVRDLPSVAEARTALAAKPDPGGTAAVMERQILALATEYGHRNTFECEVWAMGLGNQWGLVGLPGEILDEIGLRITQLSPFRHTAVVELALDCPGYFPTDAAREEGGYEPMWSPAGKGAETALVDAAVLALHDAINAQT